MEPIPESLKHLETNNHLSDVENGKVLTLLDFNGILIYNVDDKLNPLHPLCCFLRAKYFHHSERLVLKPDHSESNLKESLQQNRSFQRD